MNDGPPLQPSLAETLHGAAVRVPGNTAVRCGATRLTYAELDRQVDAAAALLAGDGVVHGDRVAVMVGNSATFVVVTYAAWRLGAVAVPINTALTAPEIAAEVTDCDARALVLGTAYADTVGTLQGTLPHLDVVYVADTTQPVEAVTGMRSWQVAMTNHEGAQAPTTAVGMTDLALLAYTSGTSGSPRGAMLTHGQILANHRQMAASGVGTEPSDVVFTALPLFNSYALSVAMAVTLTAGATLELADGFDPADSLRTIADRGVTVVVGAPPMYDAWMQTPGAAELDLSEVRLATSGGARLPGRVLRGCMAELNLDIREGYGLVEAAPVVASSAGLEVAVPGCVGRPLEGIEVRIVEDGRVVEPGDPGLIQVRGPNVFSGYWRSPDATAGVLDTQGWLDTGDIGLLDHGLLYLVDRASDVIVVSGFTVYPIEVEQALASHPDVVQSAVLGVPHPHTGQAITAFVVCRDGTNPTVAELTGYLANRLASFKRPASIECVAELPTLPAGGIRRRLLRDG